MKKKLSHIIISCCTIFFCTNLNAQTVSGKWYGFGYPDAEDATNTYMCEFILTQKGSTVTGEFNYYFRNGYFSNKITGSFNAKTRLLSIHFLPIMYFRTENTLMGVDCTMKGEFTLITALSETSLIGNFLSDAMHTYTCVPIKIKMHKQQKNEPTLKETVFEPKEIKKDTTAELKESPEKKIENEARRQLKMRVSNLITILDVIDDSVKIDLYDNADFDYDTITLFYNNNLKQYKQLLDTKKPISFFVPVDSIETNNDLVMFAENLGLIPPNAAIMIITDRKYRYEVSLTSSFRTNAAVRLRKLKPTVLKTNHP